MPARGCRRIHAHSPGVLGAHLPYPASLLSGPEIAAEESGAGLPSPKTMDVARLASARFRIPIASREYRQIRSRLPRRFAALGNQLDQATASPRTTRRIDRPAGELRRSLRPLPWLGEPRDSAAVAARGLAPYPAGTARVRSICNGHRARLDFSRG
jgi:hypothetical protein